MDSVLVTLSYFPNFLLYFIYYRGPGNPLQSIRKLHLLRTGSRAGQNTAIIQHTSSRVPVWRSHDFYFCNKSNYTLKYLGRCS